MRQNLHGRTRIALLAFTALTAIAATAVALPQNGTVTSGQATISQPSASQLLINQTSDKAIINWQGFDILSGESTRFIQPSANSVALNRISGNATQILGSLSANGHIMLVNPNGIFFGKGAQVNVAGLIATTADIRDQDFMAGRNAFTIPGRPDASIINKGTISAADGGLVALVAPGVENDGVISAKLGTVQLGSAKAFTLDFYGDNLYSFTLTDPASAAAKDQNGNPLAASVVNNGTVSGGNVYITARAASDVVGQSVNMNGVVEAQGSHNEGGNIVLDGGDGAVNIAGTLDASAPAAGAVGGNITVTGRDITLASTAKLDASGSAGGGSIFVGGGAQGQGTLAHAATVTADKGSLLSILANDSGNGGTAVVWSDNKTDFQGTVIGTGGKTAGNGGSAEISSKGTLAYNGLVDLSAAHGKAGTLTLDPADFTIDSSNNAAIENTLNTGSNVVESATGNGSVLADIDWSGAGSLTLTAGGHINLTNADIAATTPAISSTGRLGAPATVIGGNVTLNSGDYIRLTDSSISTTNGLTLNNNGIFLSNHVSDLKGATVSLRQKTGGNLQYAIDSVDPLSGKTTLGLAGTFTGQFYIDNRPNFTLTNIYQGAPATLHGIGGDVLSVNNSAGVTVSNLAFDGGTTGTGIGIGAFNSSNLTLTNNAASNLNTGYYLKGVTGTSSMTNNTYSGINGNGIYLNGDDGVTLNGNNTTVSGLGKTGATGDGIAIFNSKNINANNNVFASNGAVGIGGIGTHVENSQNVNVTQGVFASTGATGTTGTGTLVQDSSGAKVNTLVYGIGAGSTGSANTAVGILNSPGTQVTYDIRGMDGGTGAVRDGVYVADSAGSFLGGTLVASNNTKPFAGNTTGVGGNLVNLNNSPNTVIQSNTTSSTNGAFGYQNGVVVNSSNGTQIAYNSLEAGGQGPGTTNGGGQGVGIAINNSNDVTITNTEVDNERWGIALNNAQNTQITGATLRNDTTGIFAQASSDHNTLASSTFTNDRTGIYLQDPGTFLVFAETGGSTSTFTHVGNYFDMENFAMQGHFIDAGQETFEGVKGVNFTPDQLAAAEAKTMIGNGVGQVRYDQ